MATPLNPSRSRRSAKSAAAKPPPVDAPVAAAPVTSPDSLAANLRENSIVTRAGAFEEPPDRWAMIAVAAYFLAERRGFQSGHEQEDWLVAEREVDAAIAGATEEKRLSTAASGAVRGPPN